MGRKWPGRGAAIDRLENRGFNLNKPALLKHPPHAGNDACAGTKHLPHLAIDDQIEIALAQACLRIGQPMPFLGRWVERFCQQRHSADKQRRLTIFCAAQRARDLNDVEGIQVLANTIKPCLTKIRFADPELDGAAFISDVDKNKLAEHPPTAMHAPDQGHWLLLLGKGIKLGKRLRDGVCSVAAERERLYTGSAQSFELRQTLALKIM